MTPRELMIALANADPEERKRLIASITPHDLLMLDADFDRQSSQRFLLRTHELGHALGYHHVQSRPSVMNPRVGNAITEFDRAAIRYASQPLEIGVARIFTPLHTALF